MVGAVESTAGMSIAGAIRDKLNTLTGPGADGILIFLSLVEARVLGEMFALGDSILTSCRVSGGEVALIGVNGIGTGILIFLSLVKARAIGDILVAGIKMWSVGGILIFNDLALLGGVVEDDPAVGRILGTGEAASEVKVAERPTAGGLRPGPPGIPKILLLSGLALTRFDLRTSMGAGDVDPERESEAMVGLGIGSRTSGFEMA